MSLRTHFHLRKPMGGMGGMGGFLENWRNWESCKPKCALCRGPSRPGRCRHTRAHLGLENLGPDHRLKKPSHASHASHGFSQVKVCPEAHLSSLFGSMGGLREGFRPCVRPCVRPCHRPCVRPCLRPCTRPCDRPCHRPCHRPCATAGVQLI